MRRRHLFVLCSLLAALFLPSCAGGQDQAAPADTAQPAAEAAAPAGTPDWQVRADAGHDADAGFALTTSEAGTRITTSRFSGILFRPAQVASGTYEVIAAIDVLPGSRRSEGYGVIIGGTDLDGDGQRYTYVLLRDDGKYLVKTREGGGTSTVVDWTASPAIRTLPESAAEGDRASNTLVVQVTPNAITVLINGERVLRRPRGDLALDGIAGIRVNHGLELQVQSFDVAAPSAPAE